MGADFIPWRSPEQVRTLIANGAVDAVITTLPTAAVLSNKGIPCRIVAVYSAPLWIVATDAPGSDALDSSPTEEFASLHGKEVLLPFGPGNMPELALKALTSEQGMELKLRHCGSIMEAANLLRLGRATHALLAEPAATLVMMQNSQKGGISKRFMLKDVWPHVFPGQPVMPTAALVMVGPLAKDESASALVLRAFLEGATWTEENGEAALRLAEVEYPELGQMFKAAPGLGISELRSLGLLTGEEGENAARFMLERLFAINPASVGGRLPGEDLWGLGDAAP
ncbi:substrate-binding domain-containing protein [Desulfonatronum thiodismutans]|uniref:ABC transporter substrate-binding protein n=1 Tax=Desulfonatronum thiodismutans TaxID=159290 RepID=UPI0004ABEC29|nr:ABC transporter substrate-binding protein [Desulfonatronum thiodismutans]